MGFVDLRVFCNVVFESCGFFEFIVEFRDFGVGVFLFNLYFVMMGIFWLGEIDIKIIIRIRVKIFVIVIFKKLLERFLFRDCGNKEWINFKICC